MLIGWQDTLAKLRFYQKNEGTVGYTRFYVRDEEGEGNITKVTHLAKTAEQHITTPEDRNATYLVIGGSVNFISQNHCILANARNCVCGTKREGDFGTHFIPINKTTAEGIAAKTTTMVKNHMGKSLTINQWGDMTEEFIIDYMKNYLRRHEYNKKIKMKDHDYYITSNRLNWDVFMTENYSWLRLNFNIFHAIALSLGE